MRCKATEKIILTQKELNSFYDFYSLVNAIGDECATEDAKELIENILKNLETLDEDYLVGEGIEN